LSVVTTTMTGNLRRADEMFSIRLSGIGDDQWHLPTPCNDWDVRQVVGHVVAGSAMAARILRGGSRNEAIAVLGVDHLGADPAADYRRLLDEQAEAFDSVSSLDIVCEHPAGDMTARQLLDFRVADLVLHSWDIAVACGLDLDLDLDLVLDVWNGLVPMAPFIGRLGVFGAGPSGEVPADADPQHRLLDLSGRRP
jgi:uncharacterized protein (TIGR03086 family)